MTAPSDSGTDAGQLLALALENPFGEHLQEWFNYLIREFPLWAFQARVYSHLQKFKARRTDGVEIEISSPSCYPLRLIVESILSDEEVAADNLLVGLKSEVFQRRYDLASGTVRSRFRESASGTIEFDDWYNRFRPENVCDLEGFTNQPDSGSGGYGTQHYRIGRQLLECVEDWVYAGDKNARGRADRQLTNLRCQLARELGVVIKKGKLPEGPTPAILSPLFQQGRRLTQLIWEKIRAFQVSQEAQQVLAGQNVAEAKFELWTARLALPVLSRAEILAMKAESAKSPRWTRRQGPRPTPRRFVIWVLAHRLGMQASSLAQKVLSATEKEKRYFRRTNPIKAFLN
jgi:hypothetical protein